MQHAAKFDEEVVDKARRALIAKRKARWIMLLYAALFLGLCGYATVAAIRKIEKIDAEQLKMGFVYGLMLAITWTTFGVLGALCLGKFLIGLGSDFRLQELLVCYHDRLRELGQLPQERKGEPDSAANRSQRVRPGTNSTSAAAGSGR